MGIMILIPQLKTLRLREVKQPTQAHTAGGQGRDGRLFQLPIRA